jgi:hypothetical protein
MQLTKQLVGKKIVGVGFMRSSDVDEMMWCKCPIVLEMSDGTQIFPMSDEEGNDGGALVVGNLTVAPTSARG